MATENETTIDLILDRWEEAQAEGRYVTPREVCEDRADLLCEINEYIAALEWVKRKEESFFSGGELPSIGSSDRRLARYDLVEILGAGGFGTVWKAYDTELHRDVAIKLPKKIRFDSELQRGAFFAEARNLAKLNHPNIISVYDIGQDGDQIFLVSQLVNGSNLSELIADHDLTVERSIEIIQAVAAALAYAHQQGVIHRDIKPANTLVGHDDQVLLGDFGISASENQETTDNRGTYSYMSPEQLVPGEPVDHRSDIFSLGLLAYELLTGTQPLRNTPRDGVALTKLSSPANLNPSVPNHISDAVMKALKADPNERFQSVEEFFKSINTSIARRLRVPLISFVITATLIVSSIFAWNWIAAEVERYERMDPLSHYSFADANNPLMNSGRSGSENALMVRGDVTFTEIPLIDGSSPPVRFAAKLKTHVDVGEAKAAPNAGFESNKTELIGDTAFSIAFWFLRDEMESVDTLLHLGEASGFGEQAAPQLTVWIDEKNELRFLSFHRFGHVQTKKPELNESISFADLTGKWCHLAITFETPGNPTTQNFGTFRAYLNGELMVEREKTRFGPVLSHSKSRLSIGRPLRRSRKTEPTGFDGLIADIKIWNRAVSEPELRSEWSKANSD